MYWTRTLGQARFEELHPVVNMADDVMTVLEK